MPPAADTAVRTRAWLLVAAWTGVAWWFGGGGFDAGSTSRILAPLLGFVFPAAAPDELLTLAGWVRKMAHPVVYAVLAGLAFRALWLTFALTPRGAAAAAFGFALLVGAADEGRQSLLRERTGSLRDVALDACGAAGALAVLAWRRTREASDG